MAADDTPSERQLTTDREEIKSWAERHNAVPVAMQGGDELTLVHESNIEEVHDERTWEAFFDSFEAGELVFVYHDEEQPADHGLSYFDFVSREDAFDRTGITESEFEEALRKGETITTEVVETTVVEQEVTERDTIESELIETDIASRDVVDTELLDRRVIDTEFLEDDVIQLTVEERRLETIDEIEHMTVESRVVDVDIDVETHEETAHGDVRSEVDIEQIQQSILESETIHADISGEQLLADEVIRSHRTEGDAVHSELIEQRTVEEEVRDRHDMRYTLEESTLLESDVVTSEIIERELVDIEAYGDSPAQPETAAGSGAGRGTDPEPTPDAANVAAGGVGGAVSVTEDEQGKDVVDETGHHVGIVATVEAGTIYVDPEPGLADRLKARLNWGSHEDESYPVEQAQINEITDDEVILRGE